MGSARDHLARILATIQPSQRQSTSFTLPAEALTLNVGGFGPVSIPLKAATARALINQAEPAPYGHGEQTLNDATVRDTWQITNQEVTLGGPTWAERFGDPLTRIAHDLGLPGGAKLDLELHSLLVYGKGQFFLPHQDSEKHQNMVATLVVMLPSVHTGGELVVDDGGEPQTYKGSRKDLTLVAFYADRRHEVLPVTSGYRAALTFNLLITDAQPQDHEPIAPQVATQLSEHFSTSIISQYGGRNLGTPQHLGFLLDHEYTQRGLAAGLFKSVDAARVQILRSAARMADCELVIGQVDIQETWQTDPDHDAWPNPWDGADEEWDDEELTDPHDDEPYSLEELIETELKVTWWVDAAGGPGRTVQQRLEEHEVCTATSNSAFEPYENSYEGYMGNYGNTADLWYRRAIVLLWPSGQDFTVRAAADHRWALAEIRRSLEAEDRETARANAALLAPLWTHVEPELFQETLVTAAASNERSLATQLLEPFNLCLLTEKHAKPLSLLATSYGERWVAAQLRRWHDQAVRRWIQLPSWTAQQMPALVRQLRALDLGTVAAALVRICRDDLQEHLTNALNRPHPAERRRLLTELGEPMTQLLASADKQVAVAITEALTGHGRTALDLGLAVVTSKVALAHPHRERLARWCAGQLETVLAEPVRAAGDWSMEFAGCGCPECATLQDFLADPDQQLFEWKLATGGRGHIHSELDEAGLPVSHTTRRTGRPYTLVLQKTEELFRQESAERQRQETELAALRERFA